MSTSIRYQICVVYMNVYTSEFKVLFRKDTCVRLSLKINTMFAREMYFKSLAYDDEQIIRLFMSS